MCVQCTAVWDSALLVTGQGLVAQKRKLGGVTPLTPGGEKLGSEALTNQNRETGKTELQPIKMRFIEPIIMHISVTVTLQSAAQLRCPGCHQAPVKVQIL